MRRPQKKSVYGFPDKKPTHILLRGSHARRAQQRAAAPAQLHLHRRPSAAQLLRRPQARPARLAGPQEPNSRPLVAAWAAHRAVQLQHNADRKRATVHDRHQQRRVVEADDVVALAGLIMWSLPASGADGNAPSS